LKMMKRKEAFFWKFGYGEEEEDDDEDVDKGFACTELSCGLVGNDEGSGGMVVVVVVDGDGDGSIVW